MSRSKWKGEYTETKNRKVFEKNTEVVSWHVGKRFLLHNGSGLVEVVVKSGMVGFKFGEFVPTRARYVFKKKKLKKKWGKK